MMTRRSKRRRSNANTVWSDLPIEIWSKVAERLPYLDLIRFGAVCKSNWEAVNNLVQRRRRPRLLSCRRQGRVDFLDLLSPRTYSIKPSTERADLLSRTNLKASKFGWLLLLDEDKSHMAIKKFYFYNPFCNKVIELPPLYLKEKSIYVGRVTFTTPPTSPDCVVFVVGFNHWVSEFKDNRWSDIHQDCIDNVSLHLFDVNYINGKFYCIFEREFSFGGVKLILCTFDAALKKWIIMHDSSDSLPTESAVTWVDIRLVGCDGDILLAQRKRKVLNSEDDLIINRFSCSRKIWSTVESLGNQALFLGQSSSVASPVVLENDSKHAGMIYYHERLGYGSWRAQKDRHVWKLHQVFSPATGFPRI